MSYYRATFSVLIFFLLLSVGAFVSASWWSERQRGAFTKAAYEALRASDQRASAESEERVRDQQVRPLREFAKAWEPYLRPAPAKDLGNHLRNALATLATRTGLTSEGATVPGEPRSYLVGSNMIKAQQVSLNVISESLPAIVTWLGAVENQFAYARIESLTLSGYASRSVQLGVTLLHPVDESSPRVSVAAVTASPGVTKP